MGWGQRESFVSSKGPVQNRCGPEDKYDCEKNQGIVVSAEGCFCSPLGHCRHAGFEFSAQLCGCEGEGSPL